MAFVNFVPFVVQGVPYFLVKLSRHPTFQTREQTRHAVPPV